MLTDNELLDAYARYRSEGAFRELVERRTNFVYSVALRHVGGQAHLAQEVTQAVFTDLARKAASVAQHPALQGWLFKSTYFSATALLRAERRRVMRETEAHAMQPSSPDLAQSADWQRLQPAIDEAVSALGEKDREAVLLRFVHGWDFAAVGAQLRLSEEGARSRVNRALDKMRSRLVRRGIASTTAALGVALGHQPLFAAPAGLAAKVASAALIGGGSGTIGLFSFLSWSLLVPSLAALTLAAASLSWIFQYQTNRSLQRDVEALRPTREIVGQLRTENSRLRQELAALTAKQKEGPRTVQREAAAAMIPIDWLNSRDGTTPINTFETLYWAKEHIEISVLEKRIVLSTASRERAARYYAELPLVVKQKFAEVTSPEGLIAFAWAMGPAVSALRLDQQIENGPDDVTLIGKIRYQNERLMSCELQLVRTVGGWQWRPSDPFVNEILDSITQRLHQS